MKEWMNFTDKSKKDNLKSEKKKTRRESETETEPASEKNSS